MWTHLNFTSPIINGEFSHLMVEEEVREIEARYRHPNIHGGQDEVGHRNNIVPRLKHFVLTNSREMGPQHNSLKIWILPTARMTLDVDSFLALG